MGNVPGVVPGGAVADHGSKARAESAQLVEQGLALGKQAEAESSADLGKQALGLLRRAVSVDATNGEAWKAFGRALLRIDGVAWVKRPFAISMVGGGDEQFKKDCDRAAKALQQLDPALAQKLAAVEV